MPGLTTLPHLLPITAGQTGSGKTHTMSPLPIRASADIMRWVHAAHEYWEEAAPVQRMPLLGI
jgi:hypothetical protein